jgi:hypothetical protein
MSETKKLAEAAADAHEEKLKSFMTFMEEEVELPSLGKTYASKASSVKIKPMRGIEEDILTNQKLVRTGAAFDLLLKNCITEWNGIQLNELLFGDMNVLYVALRSLSYGSDYQAHVICPECGGKDRVETNLSEFSPKLLSIDPVTIGKNEFLWESKEGFKIGFRMLTNGDNKHLQALERQQKAQKLANPEIAVTDFLTQIILSITNPQGHTITNKLDIRQIVKNHLSVRVIQEFTSFINEHRPDIDMAIDHECTSCGAVNRLQVPITADFFWPAGRGGSERSAT